VRRLASISGAAALVLLTCVVTGCSGAVAPSASAAAGGSSSGDAMAVWQQFTACARAHGVPGLPDPQVNAAGKVSFPGYDGRSMPDAVRTACQPILDALPVGARPSANPAPTDIAALLRFAQCMRQQGFPNWPDPKSDGTFPAAQLPSMKTPALVSAMHACDHLNPDRGGHVYGS